ncbi:MAG: RNA polymerase sigma factor [Bacteroides sp.]|nr:RNA polymerase sigma factor [Bacteroides sp.]
MDAEIFKRKFLPYHKRLYYIAYRLLENEADAQDIVQEAYLKMWNKREGLTVISNPEAFSVTLVRNMCFDLLRSGKYLLQRQCVELATIHEQPQNDRSEEKEQAYMIRQLIATLPEQQQQIITLRDIRECSYEEIEKITGLSAVNIRVILSRARKKIREQFNRKELS